MKAQEVLNTLHISRQTLKRYRENGMLKATLLESGHYDFDDASVYALLHHAQPHLNVIYARVSTVEQHENLMRQIINAKTFMEEQGWHLDQVFQEVGSGIDFTKRLQFRQMMELVLQGKVQRVVIAKANRLARVGFDLLQTLFAQYGTEIVLTDYQPDDQTEIQEFYPEMMHFMSHFNLDKTPNEQSQPMIIVNATPDASVQPALSFATLTQQPAIVPLMVDDNRFSYHSNHLLYARSNQAVLTLLQDQQFLDDLYNCNRVKQIKAVAKRYGLRDKIYKGQVPYFISLNLSYYRGKHPFSFDLLQQHSYYYDTVDRMYTLVGRVMSQLKEHQVLILNYVGDDGCSFLKINQHAVQLQPLHLNQDDCFYLANLTDDQLQITDNDPVDHSHEPDIHLNGVFLMTKHSHAWCSLEPHQTATYHLVNGKLQQCYH